MFMRSLNAHSFKIKKIGSFGRKQILAVRKYGSSEKLLNLLHCEMENRTRAVRTSAMPYTAIVDVTNICNLRCPGCPTGLGLKGRQGTFLDLRHLRTFLDQTADALIIANLFNWGESSLHPEAADIVSSVHERGIFTSISSNLNIRDPQRLEDLCDAGLDHLLVSVDGATEASYSKYRRGGDFDLVLNNIRQLAAYKKRKRKTSPVIEWQLLAFRHLETEIIEASHLAKQVGAEWFTVRGAIAPAQFQPTDAALQGNVYNGKGPCNSLWRNITLQSDGGIAPCCMIYGANDDFGHIESTPIRQLRNNERYLTARKLFKPQDKTTLDVDLRHPCLRCPIVHRQKHLAKVLAGHGELFTHEGFQSVIASADELNTVATRFTLCEKSSALEAKSPDPS